MRVGAHTLSSIQDEKLCLNFTYIPRCAFFKIFFFFLISKCPSGFEEILECVPVVTGKNLLSLGKMAVHLSSASADVQLAAYF